MVWCCQHYRWSSYRHLRSLADLRASTEHRPGVTMDGLCSLNHNQLRQPRFHPPHLQRNRRLSLSRNSCHRFPGNHTSDAIRSSVLLGETTYCSQRNSLTHPTTLHDAFLWHSSNHWLRINEDTASPVKDGSTTSLGYSAPYMRRGISMTGVSRPISILLPHCFTIVSTNMNGCIKIVSPNVFPR